MGLDATGELMGKAWPRLLKLLTLLLGIAQLVVGVPATAQTADEDGPYRRPSLTTNLLPERNVLRASFSADGRYVVFESPEKLVAGDTNKARDIFVLDREDHGIERVSVASDGTEADGGSFQPHITPDGRYVAFASGATNLVPSDANVCELKDSSGNVLSQWNCSDVFVHDRVTRTTHRVSVGPGGREGNKDSFDPVISADGRFVGFSSVADNLVQGDTNKASDVFVHDVIEGVTDRVSVTSEGGQADGDFPDSYAAGISADGSIVAFTSRANLAGPEFPYLKAFVHDRVEGVTELASADSEGNPAEVDRGQLALSADGRFVFYESGQGSPNKGGPILWEVFMYDRNLGRAERVSISSDGTSAEGAVGAANAFVVAQPKADLIWAQLVGASPDGRLVLFASNMGLGHAGTDAAWNLFVRNVATGETQLVSESSGTGEPEGYFTTSPFTADGSEVVLGMGQGSALEAGAGLYVSDIGGSMEVLPDVTVSRGSELLVEGKATFWGVSLTGREDDPGDIPMEGTLPDDVYRAGDLVAARVVGRPEQGDVLVRLDVDRLPADYGGNPLVTTCYQCPQPYNDDVRPWAVAPTGPFASSWNLEMSIGGVRYQVRASYPDVFALLRCDPVCTPEARIRGGIGVSGNSVVLSIRSSLLPLTAGGEVSSVRAFTALTGQTGQQEDLLDQVNLPSFQWPGPAVVQAELSGEGLASSYTAQGEIEAGEFSVKFPTPPAGEHHLVLRACLGQTCGPALEPQADGSSPPDPEPVPQGEVCSDEAKPLLEPVVVCGTTVVSGPAGATLRVEVPADSVLNLGPSHGQWVRASAEGSGPFAGFLLTDNVPESQGGSYVLGMHLEDGHWAVVPDWSVGNPQQLTEGRYVLEAGKYSLYLLGEAGTVSVTLPFESRPGTVAVTAERTTDASVEVLRNFADPAATGQQHVGSKGAGGSLGAIGFMGLYVNFMEPDDVAVPEYGNICLYAGRPSQDSTAYWPRCPAEQLDGIQGSAYSRNSWPNTQQRLIHGTLAGDWAIGHWWTAKSPAMRVSSIAIFVPYDVADEGEPAEEGGNSTEGNPLRVLENESVAHG